ncbi:MAG: hypothetical protein JW880_04045 [Candidatus Thermoplasmatota archaeon]|nr:hypothetical protein [Candidatus Thermoplasmatota archaeon]
MASSFPERGFVADLYLPRPRVETRPRNLKLAAVTAAVLGFVVVLLCDQVPGALSESGVSTQESSEGQSNGTYEFVVYVLNHTTRTSNGTTTLFTFDIDQLPFDFDDLEFGDFREDPCYLSRYYGGMSLLARAEGSTTNISFEEANGKPIEQIAYQSQSLVVLNGWESVSKDGAGVVIDHKWGSMQIVAYDWRDGGWSPGDGIAVEHPAEVTVSGATLCLMVYEPGDTTDIPEFGPLLACVTLVVLVFLARRRRS